LILKRRDLVGHLTELVRVFEGRGAAVGSIDAVESEVAASLARGLAIALDLSALAFIACYRDVAVALLLLLLLRIVALAFARVAATAILG